MNPIDAQTLLLRFSRRTAERMVRVGRCMCVCVCVKGAHILSLSTFISGKSLFNVRLTQLTHKSGAGKQQRTNG